MITVLLSITKYACLIVCMWLLSVQFLIGYNRGLIVLWDNKESKTEQTYNATQVSGQSGGVQGESVSQRLYSVCFSREGVYVLLFEVSLAECTNLYWVRVIFDTKAFFVDAKTTDVDMHLIFFLEAVIGDSCILERLDQQNKSILSHPFQKQTADNRKRPYY